MNLITKNMYTRTITIVVAATLHALAISLFVVPSGLISSGFTGLAMLLEIIFSKVGLTVSTSLLVIILNIPIALLCFKEISKKFVLLSLLEVFLLSLFLATFKFEAIFDDILLNVLFGSVLNGLAVVLALRANASTGGTDFIALYVSNKRQKSIFNYIFVFNVILIIIFGFTSGTYLAGYTILFQFLNNYVIKTYYKRYDRLTLQIVTSKKDEIVEHYIKHFRHGVSVVAVEGGYSKQNYFMLTTVIAMNEKEKIVNEILKADPKAIINIFKSADFVGGFYLEPIN